MDKTNHRKEAEQKAWEAIDHAYHWDLTASDKELGAHIGALAAFKYIVGKTLRVDHIIDEAIGDMTHRQVASMMGISPQHFSEIYNGVKPVTMQFAAKYEKTFGRDGWKLYIADAWYKYRSVCNEVWEKCDKGG